MQGLVEWLNQPFKTDQDAMHWFLFIGLIIAALTLWGVILHDIRGTLS